MILLINLYILLSIYFQLTTSINFKVINNCQNSINIYSHENFKFNNKCQLNTNNNCILSYNNINSGLIKTELSESATLFEFSINEKGIWYDLSVIPPGSGNCYNYNECRQISNKSGFNIPIQVEINKPTQSCVNLICLNEQCPDAYLYPFDDIKTKFCNLDTDFILTYCPNQEKKINNITNIIITPNLESSNNIIDSNLECN